MIRTEFDRVTDAKGRHVPVARSRLAPKASPPAQAEPKRRTDVEFQRELDSISSGIRRLAPPNPSRPETFHEERSELARRVQRLAAEFRGAR